jgi:type IX secretion system PorP/SprF family membrane protein
MKKLLTLVSACVIAFNSFGQQDPQFSQNMFNKLYVNPAYAGSSEAICAHLLGRTQWVGFGGGPQTIVAGIESPFFDNKVGAGLSISNDNIKPENILTVKLAGAYHFDLGSAKLGAGIDVDYIQQSYDGDFVVPQPQFQTTDQAIPKNTSDGTFDLGGGLYLSSEKLYIGVSASHLLSPELTFGDSKKQFQTNLYGMIGYSFDLTPSVALKPSVFVKNVTDNTTFDLNLNAHFNDRFWIGASYRNEDAIVGMLGMNIMEGLRIGYAYDFTTSDIKTNSSGSHEIMLGYCFNKKKKMVPIGKNVRFL